MSSFYNADTWHYTQILKDAVPSLQREFARFPQFLWFNNREHKIANTGTWQFVPFIAKGRYFWPYLWAFPTVRRLLKQLPITDNCVFSIMGPGAKIPPHSGHPGDHLRVHLAIQADGHSWIRVGNETQHWYTGEVLIFDDRLEHETANPGNERVVLLFDILSKDLHD